METKYLSPIKYVLLELLYSIPVVGLVFLIIHALDKSNTNRCNFARSFFIPLIIVIILIVIVALLK